MAPTFQMGTPQATLETVAALGYRAVDGVVRDADEAIALAATARSAGLSVGALLTGRAALADGLSLSDPATADSARIRVLDIATVASSLGAALVVGLLLGRLPEVGVARARAEATLIESLREVCDRTRETDTQVLLEPLNRYESNVARTASDASALIERAGGGLGLVLDSFHANIEEADPCASAAAHAHLVGLVQLSDSNRRIPGDGHFPMRDWIAALRSGGYDGPFAIEAEFGPDAPDEARRALVAVRALVG